MKKLLILTLLLSACATSDGHWSAHEKKLAQEKTFKVKSTKIRDAFKKALMEDGYQITSATSDILVANSPTWDTEDADKKRRNSFLSDLGFTTSSTTAAMIVNRNYDNVNTVVVTSAPSTSNRQKIGTKYSISVNFEEKNSQTKSTMVIFKTELFTAGSETTQELEDSRFYKLIYDKVNYELYK